jgi:hypothetical protein
MRAVAAVLAALVAGASAQSNSLCPAGKNCIPGLMIVQNGIDVVKGTQNGTDKDPQHEYLLPVYEMTFDKGYKFTNQDGVTWDVPDQAQAFSNPKLISVANSAFVESYQQWITAKSSSFSFGIGVQGCYEGAACMGLNFNYNQESYKYKNDLKADTQQASFSEMQWTHYTLQALMPPFAMAVSPGLSAYLAQLPAKVTTPTDQEMYSRVVQYWGSHVAMSADLGAYAHVTSFASNSYVQSVSQQWAAHQWALNFDFTLFDLLNITGNAGGFQNKSSIHVNQSFVANTKSYDFYRGGNTAKANSSQAEWLQSTIANPAWVTTRLTSLSDIVPLTDPAVANNLEATIKFYIKEGKLPTSPAETRPLLEETYPRPVKYYSDNWAGYFLAGRQMPKEHAAVLRMAGRL